ncbi:MAG: acyl-CoA dehydrogenase family protein [Microthrixaceae bacterium]
MSDPADLVQERVEKLLAEHEPTQEDQETFRGHQFDAGLAWVHFPEGWGGLDVAPKLQKVVDDAIRDAGAKPADARHFFGLAMAGPTVVTHGDDEARKRLLRPMFTGEDSWCQLFSEPGAGSDLAGLACKAVRDGDEWVITGQTVWNTLAHQADRGMLVTRTDPDAPKHKGLTYFALDMHAPGVDVRPLRQITGEAEFNEVYLTDAKVPDADRIGAEGEGWRVALTTLGNERSAIGGATSEPKRGSGPIANLVELWKSLPTEDRSPIMRDRIAGLWIRAEVGRLTNIRASASRRSGNPGPEGSISKLAFTQLNKDITETEVDLLGAEALAGFDYSFRRPETLSVTGENQGPRYAFMRARANSIEGGTSEVMRNILGEQVLGLPGEPRADKGIPWKDIPRS